MILSVWAAHLEAFHNSLPVPNCPQNARYYRKVSGRAFGSIFLSSPSKHFSNFQSSLYLSVTVLITLVTMGSMSNFPQCILLSYSPVYPPATHSVRIIADMQ